MDWEPDGPSPCDGTVGVDAAALLTKLGSLSGIRARDLRGRDFTGADLTTADLSGAQLRSRIFKCANLRLATLRDVDILRTDLRWVDLRGATLRGARIAATDLRHADLRDTDLRGVTFDCAQDHDGWRGCNLADVVLDGADLRGIRYRAETIWPEGFDAADAGAQLLQ